MRRTTRSDQSSAPSASRERVAVRALVEHADSENGTWRAVGDAFTLSAERATLKAREGFVTLIPAATSPEASGTAPTAAPAAAPAATPAATPVKTAHARRRRRA